MLFIKPYIVLIALAGLLFAAGCKKEDKGGKFAFVNGLNQPVHIDVYRAQDDYNTKTNIYISQTIQARDSFTVAKESMTSGKFYADWYSADYMYSNWGVTAQYDYVSGGTPVWIDTYKGRFYMWDLAPHTARLVCLNGDEPETHWKAVDAFDYDGKNNVWSSITTAEKDIELIIRRDMSVAVIAKDAQQNAVSHRGWVSEVKGMDPFYATIGDFSFSNSTATSVDHFENGSLTKDSLILSFGLYNYRMVRK